jgi:hypothetical protein
MWCFRNRSTILVTEHDPKEGTEPGEEEEGAVEEDMSALGDKTIFEEDEDAAEECGARPTAELSEG